MNIRDRINEKYPHLVSKLLDIEFDAALLGWVSRGNMPPTPAYSLVDFIPIAVALWDEVKAVEYVQATTENTFPDVVFVDQLPGTAIGFWQLVRQGMLAWDMLNAAVCGIAVVEGHRCAVYDEKRVLEELAAALDDSTEPSAEKYREFYETGIRSARLGNQTPLMLCTDRTWPLNNRLGPRPGHRLPNMSVPEAPKQPDPTPCENQTQTPQE